MAIDMYEPPHGTRSCKPCEQASTPSIATLEKDGQRDWRTSFAMVVFRFPSGRGFKAFRVFWMISGVFCMIALIVMDVVNRHP